MKPLNIDKSGCSNTSSNCVVWQGPDIPCISLCKGDSITEVVYKLATELCIIMDTFDMKEYDLKCFAGGACKPETFKEFIQLVINKICYVQECSGCLNSCDPCNTVVTPTVPVVPTPSGGDPVVPIAPAFRYVNQFGDTVTTMTTSEYAVTVGNTVSNIITTITTINSTLVNHNTRIIALETAPPPVFTIPTMVPVCVTASIETSVVTVLTALEQQFCELRTATGTPNNIFTNIGKAPAGLGSAKSLANPLTTLSALPGFNNTVANEADSIGNIWVVMSDMRLAIKNIIDNYLPSDCASIGMTIFASYAPTTVTIFINGTIPGTFSNTFPAGTIFTITDDFGASMRATIDIPSMINTMGGYPINISGSGLNVSSNLTITASPSFTSTVTGSQCQSTLQYVIVNQANCVVVTYGVTSPAQIDYSYTTAAITATYKIELWDALTNTLLGGYSVANTIVQTVTGSFLPAFPVLALTQYKLRLVVTVNSVDTYCDFTLVTTT